MIEIRPVTDPGFIRGVFTHPDVWDWLCDDGSRDSAAFEPAIHPLVAYVAPCLDGEPMGCLMLVRGGDAVMELHSALLPAFRGRFTQPVFNALLDFIRAQFPAVARLRTWVPGNNRAAFVAAKRVGFAHVGTEPRAFRKDNQLHDLHLFGVNL